MIKKLLFIIGIAPLFLLFLSFETKGQCFNELVNVCLDELDLDDVRFIRSFHVKHDERESGGAPQVTRLDLILKKGTTYQIYSCNDKTNPGEIIVNLYREDQLIATNYDFVSRRHAPRIVYPCSESGKYHLTLTFEGGKEGCAVGVIGAID